MCSSDLLQTKLTFYKPNLIVSVMKNKHHRRITTGSLLPLMLLFLSTLTLTFQSCKGKSSSNLTAATDSLSDDALMDTVQRRTFLYFWEGAEPNSGLAPERYHVDGVYPQNDANVVTSGGSGFGIMAIDRKSTRLNSSHPNPSRMPSSA